FDRGGHGAADHRHVQGARWRRCRRDHPVRHKYLGHARGRRRRTLARQARDRDQHGHLLACAPRKRDHRARARLRPSDERVLTMPAPQMIAESLTRIRPSEIDWEPLGTHGITRKRLGYDEDTGYVTALVNIPVGWHGGGVAHYHHAFEEVFMLSGSVTVGGTHYWRAGDYFF